MRGAVAGAAFSSIATAIELLMVISMTNLKLLPYLGPGITAMGIVAAGYGLAFALAARRSAAPAKPVSGRAFEPKLAFLFAGAFAAMSLLAALVQTLLGPAGAEAMVALGGLIDTHAATASAGRLASSGTLELVPAAFAAMLAITLNTLVKAATSLIFGGRPFAIRVCPSHLGMIAALWLPWYFLRQG